MKHATVALVLASAGFLLLVGSAVALDSAFAPVPIETFDQRMQQHFGDGVSESTETIAKTFCIFLESGEDFSQTVESAVRLGAESNISADDTGVILGAGIVAFCPQFTADAEAWNQG